MRIKNWYTSNLDKIVFIFILIVLFTLTIAYIPYANIIITPTLRVLLIIIVLYILFRPSTKNLVIISLMIILLALTFILLGLLSVAEKLGDLFFLMLIFILINRFQEFISK